MSMSDVEQPSAAEIAAARELLTRAAVADADAKRAVMIELVSMPEFETVAAAMRRAQALNPADTEVAYTLSMMERLRAGHAPR
jgi:hypothetical protein